MYILHICFVFLLFFIMIFLKNLSRSGFVLDWVCVFYKQMFWNVLNQSSLIFIAAATFSVGNIYSLDEWYAIHCLLSSFLEWSPN